MSPPRVEVHVRSAPGVTALPAATVRRTIGQVLSGEGIDAADISVTFLSSQRMRALNRRTLNKDRATDVIAFQLPHPGIIVGDIYLCPSVSRRSANRLGVTEREELQRLLVHGTLHVLGYEHPESEDRAMSTMWRLQEHYMTRVGRGASRG